MSKFLKFSQAAGKYLLAAVLVIVPLFPKFPLINIPGTYVSIRFEDVLLLILAIFTLIKILSNWRNFFKDKIVQAFLIFFGVGLLSLLSGVFITQTVDFHLGILHWARRIEYVVPFFAVLTLLPGTRASENLSYFVKTLMIVIVITFIYGIGQRFFKFPIIVTQNEEYSKGVALLWTPGSHINSTFGGHYDLAAFLVFLMPVFLVLLFTLKNRISRIFLLLTSATGLWLLIATISRIGQLAYFAAVAVSFALAKKFKAMAIILVISIVLAGMSGSLDARFQRVIQVFYEKTGISRIISSLQTGFAVSAQEVTLPASRPEKRVPTPTPVPVFEDRSTSIRLNVEWPRAIRAFLKNPLIGSGYSSINLATDNDFLRMLGETGILGFLAFFLIFLRIARVFLDKALPLSSRFSVLERSFLAGLMGGVIGTFVVALFIDIFEASKFATIFWLVLGVGLYLLKNKAYDQ